jgi:hypothetical protein
MALSKENEMGTLFKAGIVGVALISGCDRGTPVSAGGATAPSEKQTAAPKNASDASVQRSDQETIGKFIESLREGRFDEAYEQTYSYKLEMDRLTKEKPRAVWEEGKQALLRKARTQEAFAAAADLFTAASKYQVIEIKGEHSFQYFLQLDYSSPLGAPLREGRLVKCLIVTVQLSDRLAGEAPGPRKILRVDELAEGVKYWEDAPPIVLETGLESDGMNKGRMYAYVIGGKTPLGASVTDDEGKTVPLSLRGVDKYTSWPSSKGDMRLIGGVVAREEKQQRRFVLRVKDATGKSAESKFDVPEGQLFVMGIHPAWSQGGRCIPTKRDADPSLMNNSLPVYPVKDLKNAKFIVLEE